MTLSSILLLEDQPLIAMEMEDLLLNAGFESIITLSSCAAALEYLADHTPSLALLDLHLRDGECTEIAKILTSRHAPFMVVSGSGKDGADEVFLECDWITKPWNAEVALLSIKAALARIPVDDSTSIR